MARTSYDPACEDLARHFLVDDDMYTDEKAKLLAQHIQTAIEDWLAYQEAGEGHLC